MKKDFWKKLDVAKLTFKETHNLKANKYSLLKDKLYLIKSNFAALNENDFITNINDGLAEEVQYFHWASNTLYKAGDYVKVKDDFYLCLYTNKQGSFQESSLEALNPFNPLHETITAGNYIFGLYANAHGKLESLKNVPKHNGLIYIDDDTGIVYCYIKNKDLENAVSFGWTPLHGRGETVITHAGVKTDGTSIVGDGIKEPLRAFITIPDFNPAETYKAGRVVHAYEKDGFMVEGIYRADTDITKVIWEELPCKRLVPYKASLVEKDSYVSVDGCALLGLNTIYKVTDVSSLGLAILYEPDKPEDLVDHINKNHLKPVDYWLANKAYNKDDVVQRNGKIYICKISVAENAQPTFIQVIDENNSIKWTLLADVSTSSATPIGGVIEYYGDTCPDKWLWCDGSLADKKTIEVHNGNNSIVQKGYAALYTVIGDKFKIPNEVLPEGKFRLPRETNKIIRTN